MSNKPPSNDALKDRLSRSREVNISVSGRKSGRTISIPVWFVSEDNKLYLLPVSGSDTQWYKNVLKNPSIQIEAGGAKAERKVAPVKDPKQVIRRRCPRRHSSDIKHHHPHCHPDRSRPPFLAHGSFVRGFTPSYVEGLRSGGTVEIFQQQVQC